MKRPSWKAVALEFLPIAYFKTALQGSVEVISKKKFLAELGLAL